ncbi:MAG TPA: hypothetical protein DC047_05920 [Blastocatellia bacterium]|nr:hypothetical protein [Blastocatellia bacterium]
MLERPLSIIKRFNGGLILIALVPSILCIASAGCVKGLKRGPIPGVRETLLFRASAKGDVNQVRNLLDSGTNVDAREGNGETPLMYAAVEDRTEVVKLLLDRGAAVNAVSLNGETALVRAVGVSHYETVTLLLNRGADIEKGVPLMAAAGEGDLEMIKLLLNRGARINAVDNEGYTALAAAVSRRASPEAVRLLLSAGANVNVKNKRGETPLSVAERNGDEALVSLLKEARNAKHTPRT